MDKRRGGPPSLAKHPSASFGGAGALNALAAAALGALAGIYQLYFTTDFLNDHFMHVAWARQMLAGCRSPASYPPLRSV
jgi:hypothetical protein